MELDLFSEVRFLEIWNVCEEEISVKAAAKCFFVKGHFAVAMLTDVFLSYVSDADLLHCKAFNEWRPYVISMYYLVIPYNGFMQSRSVTHFLHGVDNHSVGQISTVSQICYLFKTMRDTKLKRLGLRK